MELRTLNPSDRRGPVKPGRILSKPAGGGIETTPLPSRPAGAVRCTFLSVNHGIHRQVAAQEATNAVASGPVSMFWPAFKSNDA